MDNYLILIVDDNPNYVTLQKRALKRNDWEIQTVSSAQETLEFCQQREPAVMLLDIMMPGMDGLELFSILRERYPLIKVIFVTAVSNEERAITALNLGAYGYMQKPIILLELQYQVEQAIKARQSFLALQESETRYRKLYDTLRVILQLLTEHLKQNNGYDNR